MLLLTPPFDKSDQDPGYIKGYPPGIRENGGQYTHAAVWALMAIAKPGNGDEAAELFHMLNPINHTRTPRGCASVSDRAVRARRRCLRAAAARRPRRLELVYGIGRLAVSRRTREASSACAPRRSLHGRSVRAVIVDRFSIDVAPPRHDLRDRDLTIPIASGPACSERSSTASPSITGRFRSWMTAPRTRCRSRWDGG